MGKLSASIDKKVLKDRPDLMAFLKDVQAKTAAFEKLKVQKDTAKAELKLATKALKKQLKSKPPKKEVTKKTAKPTVTPKAVAPKAASKPKVKKAGKKAVSA